MAGRYDSNPFDEEEEVNPFSVSLFSIQAMNFQPNPPYAPFNFTKLILHAITNAEIF